MSKAIFGTVKWFSDQRGYGFIIPSIPNEFQINKECFVHYSQIKSNQKYKSLKTDQKVRFTPIKRDKGYHATEVEGL